MNKAIMTMVRQEEGAKEGEGEGEVQMIRKRRERKEERGGENHATFFLCDSIFFQRSPHQMHHTLVNILQKRRRRRKLACERKLKGRRGVRESC